MIDDILDAEPIARKNLVMFYLIDTSGSMYGKKIGMVNDAMRDIIPEIRTIGGSDSDVKIAMLRFGTDCKWITDKPESVETFQWKDVEEPIGLTSMGKAFEELNSKMSKESFLQSPGMSFAPIIILVSDGEPTDSYEAGLSKLKQNKWFQVSMKIALAIGAEAGGMQVLRDYTEHDELVLTALNATQFADMLKFVSVTSSQIGSTSSNFENTGKEITPEEADKLKQQQLIDAVATQFGCVDPKDVVPDPDFI